MARTDADIRILADEEKRGVAEAIRQAGLEYQARMIAAEALARTEVADMVQEGAAAGDHVGGVEDAAGDRARVVPGPGVGLRRRDVGGDRDGRRDARERLVVLLRREDELGGPPVGVERGYVTRAQAAERTLTTLRFLWGLPQGPQAAGVGGKDGFFYHFLDMETGHRFEQVELSTIDTTLLLGGVLACQEYFDGDAAAEREIRSLADSLYFRVDWTTQLRTPPLVAMGSKPERGFEPADWRGYNEAMLLYVLAIGSPLGCAWTGWKRLPHRPHG